MASATKPKDATPRPAIVGSQVSRPHQMSVRHTDPQVLSGGSGIQALATHIAQAIVRSDRTVESQGGQAPFDGVPSRCMCARR